MSTRREGIGVRSAPPPQTVQTALKGAVSSAAEIAVREKSARQNGQDFVTGVREVTRALHGAMLGKVSVPFDGVVKVDRASSVCSVAVACVSLSWKLDRGWLEVKTQDPQHPVAQIYPEQLSGFVHHNAVALHDVLPRLAAALDQRLTEYLAKLPDPVEKPSVAIPSAQRLSLVKTSGT